MGGVAEVRLRPCGAAPITLTNAHQVGELYEDETGVLWTCVAAGTPGTWREIAGPASAGAFHAIAPQRVYDSRPDRALVPGTDRVISVPLTPERGSHPVLVTSSRRRRRSSVTGTGVGVVLMDATRETRRSGSPRAPVMNRVPPRCSRTERASSMAP